MSLPVLLREKRDRSGTTLNAASTFSLKAAHDDGDDDLGSLSGSSRLLLVLDVCACVDEEEAKTLWILQDGKEEEGDMSSCEKERVFVYRSMCLFCAYDTSSLFDRATVML